MGFEETSPYFASKSQRATRLFKAPKTVERRIGRLISRNTLNAGRFNCSFRLARHRTLQRYLPIHHVCHVAPLAEELHHLFARPCQLRPTGFRVRVLLQPVNLVSFEHEVHLPQPELGSRSNRASDPSSTVLAFSTRACRQTSMSACSKEESIARLPDWASQISQQTFFKKLTMAGCLRSRRNGTLGLRFRAWQGTGAVGV